MEGTTVMRKIASPLIFTLLAGIGAFGPIAARAENLGIGDPAPKLEVKSFVKGEPVKSLEPGNFYVVEFWATWCGPCIATIPHLTELQKKHPEVTFIGVSVWEQDQKEVKPFVEKMGEKMEYRVAMDAVPEKPEGAEKPEDAEGAMAKNWMKAARQNGIPTAFIINKDNKIAWIGHPSSMDEPLAKIVSGSWDLKAAIAEHKKAEEEQAKLQKVQEKLVSALRSEDPQKILAVIEEIIKDIPSMEQNLAGLRFNTLIQSGDEDKAIELGEALLIGDQGKNVNALNGLAWSIVDPDAKHKPSPKLIQFAVKAAEQGDELAKGKNPFIADTLAKAYFDSGNAAKALETQKRAIENAKGTEIENEESLKHRLEQYQKAVDAAK